MKNSKILFLLMFAFILVACGGGDEPSATTDDNNEPAATAVSNNTNSTDPTKAPAEATATEMPAEPTAIPLSPTETPLPPTATPEPEPLTISVADVDFDDLNSYRLNLHFSFEGEGEDGEMVSGSIQGEFISVKEPSANSMSLTISGVEGMDGEEGFVTAQIGNEFYAVLPGFGCMSGSVSDFEGMTEGFSDLTNPDGLLEDLKDAPFIGVETHGGMESDCYAFDADTIVLPEEETDVMISEGVICIAKEYHVVSYISAKGEGEDTAFGSGSTGMITLEFELSDINEPIEVMPPAACDEVEAVEYPQLADATDVTQFGDILSYSTSTAFADAVDFYRTEMTALGYVEGDDTLLIEDSIADMTFTSDGETLKVTIIVNGDTVQVTVLPGDME